MRRLVLVLLALAVRTAGGQAVTGGSSGRPVIVFIHGRNQAFNVTEEMRARWFGAFRDGVEKLRLGPFVGDTADLRFVSYEGLYEPGYVAQGCAEIAIASANARGSAIDKALDWLSKAMAKTLGLAKVAYFLEDIHTYLSTQDMRCDTDRRLTDVLDALVAAHRPVVLVGHSMGTLISYHVLDPAHPKRYDIVRFVSLGSQLGNTEMVQALVGQYTPPFLPPAGVQRWVNIRGHYDYVAPELIKAQYKFPSATYFSELQITTQSGDQHSIVAYLKHPRTAAAIVRGWCDAWAPGTAPSECAQVQDVKNGDSDPKPKFAEPLMASDYGSKSWVRELAPPKH